jgi:uncharacterized membrane protein
VAENVIVVRFEEESKAYQAFSVLEQTDAEGRVRLLGAAVVERGEDGVVRAKEGGFPGAAPVGTATGGLIGLLIGVLGGPLGMLLGGATGALIGSAADTDRAVEADAVFESLANTIKPGTTAVVAQVEEPAEEIVDGEMEELGGTSTRRPVIMVEAEIAAAEDAALAAREEARRKIREQKRAERRERVREKIESLKARLNG